MAIFEDLGTVTAVLVGSVVPVFPLTGAGLLAAHNVPTMYKLPGDSGQALCKTIRAPPVVMCLLWQAADGPLGGLSGVSKLL
jgi:hypothetical protein